MAHIKSIKKLVCLQIIPSMDIGGVETGIRDMSSYLTNKNIENYVLTQKSNNKLDNKNINIHYLDNLNFKNILHQKRIKKIIRELIDRYQINLIHISSRAPAFFLANWIKKRNISLITSLHNTYRYKNFLKKYYISFLLKGDKVFANSHYVSNHFYKNFSLKNKRIEIIPRGTDTDYFNSEEKHNHEAREYLNILHPSRISSWKGHDVFINYINRLADDTKYNFMVTIVSNHNNKYEKSLDRSIKNLEISHRINFVKPTTNVKELYMDADLVVNSSIRPEGFGRTICEALSMKIPVIAPNSGGTKEQLEKFDNKLLYEINNYESFKQALYYALNNRNNISNTSRDFVLDNYSKNVMCSSQLKVYQSSLI
ncbi:MAG: glycosyltransferase [Alphaproteobacteria bacterium]|nr:glycosyltransferase [Alphaproteobacteria bacterium]